MVCPVDVSKSLDDFTLEGFRAGGIGNDRDAQYLPPTASCAASTPWNPSPIQEQTDMPKGTKVERVYEAVKRNTGDKGKAARIAQSVTGKSLATGKKPKGKS